MEISSKEPDRIEIIKNILMGAKGEGKNDSSTVKTLHISALQDTELESKQKISRKMAEKYGSEVSVVHIINIDQYLQSLGFYRLSYPDPIKKKIEEAKQEAQKCFAEIVKNAEQRNVRVKTDVIDSPLQVVAAIVNYSDHEKADLIVIGTRGRSGIGKMLLGSVASGVVTYAPCPVVVVK